MLNRHKGRTLGNVNKGLLAYMHLNFLRNSLSINPATEMASINTIWVEAYNMLKGY